MGGVGCGLAMLAGLFLFVGLVPLLGWLNWLTTLPLSLVAAIFCYLAVRNEPGNHTAQFGLLVSVLIFAIGSFRLFLGAGII